jgi:exopolyphosphatase/guanosine-5'-triphosphate,3'-diphosphate pyrophosphatase
MSRSAARMLAGRAVRTLTLTAPGEEPLIAGSSAPMGRGPAEAGADAPGVSDRLPGAKSHNGDGRGKSKRRRRKRRGPVYAPGTGPRAAPRFEPAAMAPAPVPAAPRQDPKPAVQVAPRPTDFYGALDLGTNNCRLLVAMPRDHGFRVVDAFSRIVRLGEGIGQTGRLGEAAMSRAIEALKVCGQKLAYRDVSRARMIATEACRSAANGAEFVERVRVETGLVLEIVSRETEARLAVAGCASLIDPNAGGVILFDIGGGSSELVWLDVAGPADGRRRRMSDRIREWVSLPVGVVSLSERHGGRDVSPIQFEAMVAEVAVMLEAFPNVAVLDAAVAAGEIHMLGTSGTVTTLAGVHLDLPRYDRRLVDGTWLTGTQVADLVTLFTGMDYEARCANPCIGRERADLVLAGCAILEAIRRRWPCDRLRVADRGLREGVLVEMMAEDGVWRPRSGRRADDAHG